MPPLRFQARALWFLSTKLIIACIKDATHIYRNSEVQTGGVIPDKGVRYELRVEKGDLKVMRVPLRCLHCSQAPANLRLPCIVGAVPVAFVCEGRLWHHHRA